MVLTRQDLLHLLWEGIECNTSNDCFHLEKSLQTRDTKKKTFNGKDRTTECEH